MKKELIKEEENLLDDLNNIDNEGDKPTEGDEEKPDEGDKPAEGDEEKPDEVQKSIVDLMVAGDDEAVKAAIHKHVVSTVATFVDDIGNEATGEGDEDKPAEGDETTYPE